MLGILDVFNCHGESIIFCFYNVIIIPLVLITLKKLLYLYVFVARNHFKMHEMCCVFFEYCALFKLKLLHNYWVIIHSDICLYLLWLMHYIFLIFYILNFCVQTISYLHCVLYTIYFILFI